MFRKKEKVWRNQTPDRHFWAFYYYLKRRGDEVQLEKNSDATFTLTLRTKNGK